MFLKKLLLIPTLIVLLQAPIWAQGSGDDKINPLDTRKAVGNILLSGLFGGILGLSTLSFYDQPQDNIRNITIGAGAGMIAAALYLTFHVASNPIPEGDISYKQKLHLLPVADTQSVGLLLSTRF